MGHPWRNIDSIQYYIKKTPTYGHLNYKLVFFEVVESLTAVTWENSSLACEVHGEELASVI